MADNTTELLLKMAGQDEGAIRLVKLLIQALKDLEQAKDKGNKADERMAYVQVRHLKEQIRTYKSAAVAAKGLEKATRDTTDAIEKNEKTTKKANQATDSWAGTTRSLQAQLLRLAAAFASVQAIRKFIETSVQAIRKFIETGLHFNQTIETATLGIAALITAQADLVDSQGNIITGARALDIAMNMSTEQVTKLRIAGIQTAATTEQLVDAFQQAVGAGVRVGLTLDQIRKFTIRTVQASFALGVPMNQLNQEVRSILDGTIDRNSRVAKALQLTNEEVRLAREQGRLAEFLNERMEAFDEAGKRSVSTFQVLKNNIQEAFEVFAGVAVEPLFSRLRTAGLKALQTVFDFDSAQISSTFSGLLDGFRRMFETIGVALSDGIQAAVDGARSLSDWFNRNKEAVQGVADAFGTLIREIGTLIAAAAGIPAKFVTSATSVGLMAEALRVAASFVRLIRENIAAIEAIVTGMLIAGGLASALSGNKVAIIIKALVVIATLINYIANRTQDLKLEQARRAEQWADEQARAIALGAQYRALSAEMDGMAEGSDALKEKQVALSVVTKQLLEFGGPYAEILKQQGISAKEAAVQFKELAQQQKGILLHQISDTEIALIDLTARKRDLDAARKADALGEAVKGNTASAASQMEDEINLLTTRLKAMENAYNTLADAAKSADAVVNATIIGKRPTQKRGAEDDLAQGLAGRVFALKKEIKAQIAAIEGQYDQALITIRQKIEAIRDEQLKIIDAEIALRRARAAASTDQGIKDKNLAEIEGFEADRAQIIQKANNDILEGEKKYLDQRNQIYAQWLQDTGRITEAAGVELGKKYGELFFRAFREGDWKTLLRLDDIFNIETAKANIQELERVVTNAERVLSIELQNIDTAVQSNALNTTQARKRQAAAYQQYAAVLATVIPQLEVFRALMTEKVGPEFGLQLDALIAKLAEANKNFKEFANDWQRSLRQMRTAIEDDLTDALAGVISTTQTVGEAFASFANAIVSDIAKIIAHLIALKIVESSLGGLFSQGGLVGDKSGTGTIALASGGPVFGPGTGTSDSILARLSNGEYVMTAKAVESYGVDFFDALNKSVGHRAVSRRPGRYATGGLVEAASSANQRLESRLQIGLSQDVVLRHLESTAGQKVIIKSAARNRNAMKGALGLGAA